MSMPTEPGYYRACVYVSPAKTRGCHQIVAVTDRPTVDPEIPCGFKLERVILQAGSVEPVPPEMVSVWGDRVDPMCRGRVDPVARPDTAEHVVLEQLLDYVLDDVERLAPLSCDEKVHPGNAAMIVRFILTNEKYAEAQWVGHPLVKFLRRIGAISETRALRSGGVAITWSPLGMQLRARAAWRLARQDSEPVR